MQKLKSKLSLLIVPFFVLMLVGFLGCAAFQDIVTPCYIDAEAMEYAGVEPNDVKVLGLFTSLWDAKRLGRKMDRVTAENQKHLNRMIIDDVDHHAYVSANQLTHVQEAEDFKQMAFSPSGPVGMMFPMLTAFGIGALGISKPKDKRVIDSLNKTIVPNTTTTVS